MAKTVTADCRWQHKLWRKSHSLAASTQELFRLGLLSPKIYAGSTLAKANVSGQSLSPSEMTVEEFQENAIQKEDAELVISITTSILSYIANRAIKLKR